MQQTKALQTVFVKLVSKIGRCKDKIVWFMYMTYYSMFLNAFGYLMMGESVMNFLLYIAYQCLMNKLVCLFFLPFKLVL